MRRPLSQAAAATLFLLAVAAPADAQRDRVIRQAFAPSITPFIGATGFGVRTVGVSDDTHFDYANGLAIGLQADRPLTRRTGLQGTFMLSPLTRVVATNGPAVGDLDRTVVGAIDLGIAGRLKPGAPLFVFAGGGATMALKRAALEPDGFGADPHASVGVGLDFMRFERTGFRIMYLAHFVKPSSPDEAQWTAKSSAYDQVVAIGGRMMLGKESATP